VTSHEEGIIFIIFRLFLNVDFLFASGRGKKDITASLQNIQLIHFIYFYGIERKDVIESEDGIERED